MAGLAIAAYAGAQDRTLKLPDLSQGEAAPQMRDLSTRKLSADLQRIVMLAQSIDGDGEKATRFARMMEEVYGSDSQQIDPVIQVVCDTTGDIKADLPTGVAIISSSEGQAIVSCPVSQVTRLARSTSITNLSVLKSRSIPLTARRSPFQRPLARARDTMQLGSLNVSTDRSLGTGKGTVVAVFDSGIDYTHSDFRNADGSTRLLYIYDVWDNSFKESGGLVGTKPPLVNGAGEPIGTLYTRDQINAALTNKGKVNHKDTVGHGTACMSVAAGKGSSPENAGVAPEADLIAVKLFNEKGAFFVSYPATVQWVVDECKKVSKPVSMNMSFSSQHGAHDGMEADEIALNKIVGPLSAGANICASAGNNGRDALHAVSKFGPETAGQIDVESEPIEYMVSDIFGGELLALFNKKDDWGFALVPDQPLFTEGEDDEEEFVEGAILLVYKEDGKIMHQVSVEGKKASDEVQEQAKGMYQYIDQNQNTDRVDMVLPLGTYMVVGFGTGANVKEGTIRLYAPRGSDSSFAKGSVDESMIGSPGNALNVVTVGSYVARNTWTNLDGGKTSLNLQLGGVSNFSSPGPRVDGLIKPNLSAPGQYMISALAKDCDMGKDGNGEPNVLMQTENGDRLAWQGTSASTPYVAGVVALMLEKNPKLTADKIIKILEETATSDRYTRGTPNPYWGYGKLDTAKAVAGAVKAK